MEKKKYLSIYRNTIAVNNNLKFFVFSLVFVIIVEAFLIVGLVRNTKVIIVPQINNRYTITSQSANYNYLATMGRYFANLLENFTPKTIKSNYQLFLNYVASDVYHTMEIDLFKIVENYSMTDTSSFFVVNTIKADNKKIIVIGTRTQFVTNKTMSQKKIKVVIYYKLKNGTLEVMGYEEAKA